MSSAILAPRREDAVSAGAGLLAYRNKIEKLRNRATGLIASSPVVDQRRVPRHQTASVDREEVGKVMSAESGGGSNSMRCSGAFRE